MRFEFWLLLAITLLGTADASAESTNKIVVKIKPGVSVEELSEAHPFVKLERPSTLPRVFLFSVENIDDVDHETAKFTADARIVWAQIDRKNNYILNLIPTDPSLGDGKQWHHDPDRINSSYAWAKGYSGAGQTVQVIDTPVFSEDLDLKNQLDVSRSFEGRVTAPTLPITHGTVCANLIVAEANNFCGVGVAFSARTAIFPFLSDPQRQFTDLDYAEAYAQGFSVSSNSYGISSCFSWGCSIDTIGIVPVINDALELAQRRNNTVFVFAAGNEGVLGGSSNFLAFGSTPRVMMVGATRYNGTKAIYSNIGAANWIVAPAGDEGDRTTWTSSVNGDGQQCGDVGVGTSWAAPMVSGAAAILRSAYPHLSWRDVKYILAYSADRTDPNHPSWLQNGAGRWFSNHYGFGQLNVGKAVELGATWKSLGPLQIRTYTSWNTGPLQITNTVRTVRAATLVLGGVFSRVEGVQLTLDMTVARRGEFQIELISPMGTTCLILPVRMDIGRNYSDYVTSANCFLDEDPHGVWYLRVQRGEQSQPFPWDPVDQLNRFSIAIWGERVPSQLQLVTSPAATRLSNFTITEGYSLQRLSLFHNLPATLGLFWKDEFDLYGNMFTLQGEATMGTRRLNPAHSTDPTVAYFPGGDHVLAYLQEIDGSTVIKVEVQNSDFIPLTPLTVLPLGDIDRSYLSVATLENKIVVSCKPKSSNYTVTKLILLDVDFGSRDTTPLCVPSPNNTAFSNTSAGTVSDSSCTEIVYRRDGKISMADQIDIRAPAPVELQSIGMGLVLGTWTNYYDLHAMLIQSDFTTLVTTKLNDLNNRFIRGTATANGEVFIAFGTEGYITVLQYTKTMRLQDSWIVVTGTFLLSFDLVYSHVDGLSLAVATSHEISITTYLRAHDGTFVQSNRVVIAIPSPQAFVNDIDQAVLPNGDLAVAFLSSEEIHVQVFESSIFGTLSLNPIATPIEIGAPEAPSSPSIYSPLTSKPIDESENQFPSWAIALIVLVGTMALFFGLMVIYLERKKRQHRAKTMAQQDPDLIAYTKMSV